MIKICEICGKKFKTSNKGRHCCSRKCAGIRQSKFQTKQKIEKICQFCGKKFEVIPVKMKQKYCSRECGYLARGKGKIELICQNCGEKFELYLSHLKREGHGKFCSKKCVGEWRSKHLKGENNPNFKDKLKTRTCENCGKEFNTREREQRYCSFECSAYQRINRIVRICKNCGKKFEVCPSRLKSKGFGQFCCRQCSSEYFRGPNNSRWVKRIKKVCLFCGGEFKIIPGKRHQQFCSNQCHHSWRSENLRGEKSPCWKGGKVKVVCKQCGKEFEAIRCWAETRKFCSRKCQSEYRSREIICDYCGKIFRIPLSRHESFKHHFCSKNCHQKWNHGENSPAWKGGTSRGPYPSIFDHGLRESIRMRDNYKCQICGCSELENIRRLNVHHIDYNKKNADPDNLISLCTSCHSRVNNNREKWKKYFKSKVTRRKNQIKRGEIDRQLSFRYKNISMDERVIREIENFIKI